MCDGVCVVIRRQVARTQRRAPAFSVRVVQRRASHACNHICRTSLNLRGGKDTALGGDHYSRRLIADGVADEIRSRIELRQVGMGALQLVRNSGKQDVIILLGRSSHDSKNRNQQGDGATKQARQKKSWVSSGSGSLPSE